MGVTEGVMYCTRFRHEQHVYAKVINTPQLLYNLRQQPWYGLETPSNRTTHSHEEDSSTVVRENIHHPAMAPLLATRHGYEAYDTLENYHRGRVNPRNEQPDVFINGRRNSDKSDQ